MSKDMVETKDEKSKLNKDEIVDKTDDESKKKETKEIDTIKLDKPYVDPSVLKYKKKKKVLKWIAISVLTLIILVYFGGVIYFYSHFDKGTKINQYDVSNMSVSEVEKVFSDELNAYVLEIEFKNATETVAIGDGGLKYNMSESVQQIKKKQNPFIWFVNIFTDDTFSVTFSAEYDEASMKEYLNSFDCMKPENMKESDNADVVMKDGEVVVIPDVTNTKLDRDKVYGLVFDAVAGYENSLNIEDNDCYIIADITADSELIKEKSKKAEKFLSIKAQYDFGDYIYTVSREDLSLIGYFDSDNNIQISKNNCDVFVKKFADRFTTYGKYREFNTHDGETILITGDNYGWIIDEEKEMEEFYNLIVKQKDFVKEPETVKEGFTMCEQNDIGDTYVEIDFLEQTLYVYKNGKVELETPVVTGNLLYDYKTPGGLFCIDNRAYDTYLIGPTWNLHVNMWMGFNGGIGMHDAPWRWEYGGDIYKTDGSHGCVNIPYEEAMKAIDICITGMPVVCYWLDEVEIIKQ